jgi:hypothetical protein
VPTSHKQPADTRLATAQGPGLCCTSWQPSQEMRGPARTLYHHLTHHSIAHHLLAHHRTTHIRARRSEAHPKTAGTPLFGSCSCCIFSTTLHSHSGSGHTQPQPPSTRPNLLQANLIMCKQADACLCIGLLDGATLLPHPRTHAAAAAPQRSTLLTPAAVCRCAACSTDQHTALHSLLLLTPASACCCAACSTDQQAARHSLPLTPA